jgi:hypothetical protein
MNTSPANPAKVAPTKITDLATTLYWPDIPEVTATTTSLMPGVEQCVLKHRRAERVHLVLLPGGLFSIIDHATTGRVDGGVAFALGRVITDRTQAGRAAEGFGFEKKEGGQGPFVSAGPMRWADLPDLTVTPGWPTGRDIFQWTIRMGREEALLTLSGNSNLPIGFVAIRHVECSQSLLTALGRLVIAQSNQLRFGIHY